MRGFKKALLPLSSPSPTPSETPTILGKINDHRADQIGLECDAVFEPSIHDNPHVAGDWTYEAVTTHSAYFHVTAIYQTTVAEAVRHAEAAWPFPVNIYLYPAGSGPLG